jgi:tetratricopeptide (TPR) repeat protein
VRLAAMLAVVCALAPAAARAEGQTDARPLDARAEEHFQRGLAHYKAEEYEAAIAEFQAGFEIDPHPRLLFNWAQSERLSGDCATAVELYRKLSAEEIPPAVAEVVDDNLTFCERALAHPPIQDNGNGNDDVDPVPSPDPADRATQGAVVAPDNGLRRPWYVDSIGGALVASGVVSMTIGLYYYDLSADELEAALHDDTLPEFNDHLSAARSDRLIAQIAAGVGLAAVTAGVLRYVLHQPPRPDAKRVGVAIGGSGGMFTIGGNF